MKASVASGEPSIEVESTPGQGSTLRIYLQAAKGAGPSDTPPA